MPKRKGTTNKSESKEKTIIDYVIGLPPGHLDDDVTGGRSQTVMENSMPLVKIYPGVPGFTKGMSIFNRKPAFRVEGDNKKALSYSNMLDAHGFVLNQPGGISSGNEGCIVIAYQADSFPTDSFTNDYGENFLQGMTNVASEAAASLAQMRGARSASEVVGQAVGAIKKQGGLVGKGGEFVEGAGNTASALIQKILPASAMGGINVVNTLMAGGRIDFPMVWKASTFQPSYTMTVRLYNPNPSSKKATNKYIAGPIAALMLLGIPISSDGFTYTWPFIHKIVSPGIYNLEPAFISNITVIKGGDQQQISYPQNLGVVDVRIDFGSLFNSMLASTNTRSKRPTLSTYIDGMVGTGPDSEKAGIKNFSTTPGKFTSRDLNELARLRRAEEIAAIKTKNQAPTQAELTDEEKDNPPYRVGDTIRSIANDLISKFPSGFLG